MTTTIVFSIQVQLCCSTKPFFNFSINKLNEERRELQRSINSVSTTLLLIPLILGIIPVISPLLSMKFLWIPIGRFHKKSDPGMDHLRVLLRMERLPSLNMVASMYIKSQESIIIRHGKMNMFKSTIHSIPIPMMTTNNHSEINYRLIPLEEWYSSASRI